MKGSSYFNLWYLKYIFVLMLIESLLVGCIQINSGVGKRSTPGLITPTPLAFSTITVLPQAGKREL